MEFPSNSIMWIKQQDAPLSISYHFIISMGGINHENIDGLLLRY